MKFNIQIILIAVLFGNTLFAQNRSISFETGSWEEVLKKAQSENKPIFVDAYAVWCGPCKAMASQTFTNDAVADFYNKTFINVKMDMEKGQGIELAQKWQIRAYPTLIFFSPTGELIHQACGGLNPEEFLDLGNKALNTEERLGALTQKYEQGNKEQAFVINYLMLLSSACKDVQKPLNDYFSSQKEEDLVSATNWELIYGFVSDINSREFKYLETNAHLFEALYAKEEVQSKLEQVYTEHLQSFLYDRDFDGYDTAKTQLIAKKNNAAKKAVDHTEISVAAMKEDWKGFVKKANSYLTANEWNNSQVLNSFAWTAFERVKDKKDLKTTLNWAKRSVELEENPYNLDTYAHLLNALGKKSEAITYMKKAIVIAKASNDPILADLESNLEKIEK